MLEHVASQVNPVWGVIAVIVAGLAIVAIIAQMVMVKKSEWDKHAQIALDEDRSQSEQ